MGVIHLLLVEAMNNGKVWLTSPSQDGARPMDQYQAYARTGSWCDAGVQCQGICSVCTHLASILSVQCQREYDIK